MEKHGVKGDKKITDDLQQKLQKDFIVRNMPAFASLSGASYESADGKTRHSSKKTVKMGEKSLESHKSTGLIIIGAGFLVVAILFYLAYRFLILPAMNPVAQEVVENPVKPQDVATKTDVVAPETEVAVTPVPIVVTPVVEAPVEVAAPSLPTVADADNDGLSDVAEVFIGSNAQLADTDNDSYNDKQEILSGYNPLGAGKLNENNNLGLYRDAGGSFAVIYPQAWEVKAASANSTLFSAPDQSFIQISYETSDQEYSDILSWYQSQFSDADTLSADRFIESSFGPGIISADQQIIYFLDSDRRHTFVISYIKSGDAAPYADIFKMMALTLMKL